MAKYIFKTQTRNSFWYSCAYMNLFLFLSFVGGVVGMFKYGMPNFIFIPFFVLIVYNIYLYKPTVKYWDMGGNDTLTIDTTCKTVTLGKSSTLAFNNIERVKLVLEERPTLFWMLTFGHQYLNLINGELKFFMDSRTNTSIDLQYKRQAKQIIKILNENGVKATIQNEERLKEGIPAHVWMLLITLFLLWQFIRIIFDFSQKVFSM